MFRRCIIYICIKFCQPIYLPQCLFSFIFVSTSVLVVAGGVVVRVAVVVMDSFPVALMSLSVVAVVVEFVCLLLELGGAVVIVLEIEILLCCCFDFGGPC